MARPYEVHPEAGRIRLVGDLRMDDATVIWRELREASRGLQAGGRPVDLDLSGVQRIDGAVLSLVVALRAELTARGVDARLSGASEHVQPLVHLYGGDAPPAPVSPRPAPGIVEALGVRLGAVLAALGRLVRFWGELVEAAAGILRDPTTVGWRTVPALAERAGIDGVPIVLLLNFLVGFVMAYQSANQLETYGANVFVADVVGISVTRELAPLMTAIILSGRSGAAFAAELGTMKVTEEIDALRTIGFSPIRYLVVPRLLALVLVAPVLTLLGDVVGVGGGAVVAAIGLDVSPAGYVAELRTAVFPWDAITGLIKSVGFAVAVALVGCQQGFATRGGAEGVGRRTTATVVICLFAIVIIDTVFTVFFRMFDV